jgi:hypothetical protein
VSKFTALIRYLRNAYFLLVGRCQPHHPRLVRATDLRAYGTDAIPSKPSRTVPTRWIQGVASSSRRFGTI